MENRVIKILAIDDNNDNLIVLKALLNDAFPDVKFISAGSGYTGFKLCQTEKPDVILLDIVMPGMDGYELCKKLKADERLKVIPVVMITANRENKEIRIKALDAGADAFLSKPVEESELKAQIRAMLRIKESEDLKKYQKQQLENMVIDRTEALEIELADRKKTENKLVHSLEKLNRNRKAMQNLMEDLESEMNERRKIEKNLELKNSELHFLNEIAIELAQLPLSERIEEYLPKKLKEFSGAILAVHMVYNSEKQVLVAKHIETKQSILKKMIRIIGKKNLKTEFPVTPDQYNSIIYEGFSSGNSSAELFFSGISDALGKTIKSITGIDHFYAIAIVIGNELLGNILLGFAAGALTPRKELLISFARVAAVSLQRRNAEMKLIRSEERYRMLINNQGEGVCIVDLDEKFLFANPAAEEMFGVTSGTLINHNLKDFLSPHQVPAIITGTLKPASPGKSTYEFEINRPGGEKLTLLVTATPQFGVNGKHTGSFIVFRDITDRKLAEENLRESYNFNESLLKTIPFGMDIVDENGVVLFQSETFKKNYGTETIGKRCWEFYRDDKKQCRDCPLYEGIEIGKTGVYVSHGVFGGKIFEISHTGMLFQGKKSMLEIFQDISERKNAEINITRQLEELRRWHEATLDRESRILELKKEVNDLLYQTGQPARYHSAIY
jgi:PAS domain S-box-containing protein